jgi:alcohol dehydrogenase class IV
MMRFEFATATRIIFGQGVLAEIEQVAHSMGRRILVVTGSSLERAQHLLDMFAAQKMETSLFQVEGEPTTRMIAQGLQVARAQQADLIIGIGGGSALDAGKAISALATNPGEMLDYLEVIGRGKTITERPLPYIAIPTTAGTGTEVTRNAVIGSPEHQVKVSLRSPLMLPSLALVDPELTYDLPSDVTASTGLDALTQLIEPYVSVKANPLSDAIAKEGIRRAAWALTALQRDMGDRSARDNMALASLLGGLAMANAALGAVHGFAGPVGGMFPIPHGVVCARLLPLVMEANLAVLEQRQPGSPVLARYQEVAVLLTGDAQAQPEDSVRWLQDLVEGFKIANLGVYGVSQEHIPELVEKSGQASSMKGNPIQLTRVEMVAILERAL